jgi:hypothetical protein
MELWQMDVVGGVRLVDGSEAKIVSGIDACFASHRRSQPLAGIDSLARVHDPLTIIRHSVK